MIKLFTKKNIASIIVLFLLLLLLLPFYCFLFQLYLSLYRHRDIISFM